MSEATRAIALAEAVKVGGDNILATADAFLAFLENGKAPPLVVSHTAPKQPTEATKPAVDKPKKDTAAKAAAKTEAQLTAEMTARVKATEEAATPVVTREHVAKSVEAMLKANKREEAKALLKQFGATSVSSVPEDDYEAFVSAAEGIINSEDMTA
jgi:hypothetical protein